MKPAMKARTNELTGAALDWAVLCALNGGWDASNPEHLQTFRVLRSGHELHQKARFSERWDHAGPIIAREGINLRAIRCPGHQMDGVWLAARADTNTGQMVPWVEFPHRDKSKRRFWRGPTPLVAAMRCFVASRCGDEVDVPEELMK